MTLDDRIEAMARASWGARFEDTPWASAPEDTKKIVREGIKYTLVYGFPELFSDPPTGWIAPVEPDDGMQKAGWEVQPLGPCCDWDMKTIFEAMADNYRARHPMKPTEAKE